MAQFLEFTVAVRVGFKQPATAGGLVSINAEMIEQISDHGSGITGVMKQSGKELEVLMAYEDVKKLLNK
jgi:hypothetical protein